MQKFQEYTTGPYKKKSPRMEPSEQRQVTQPATQESDPWSNVSYMDAFLGGVKNKRLTSDEWIEKHMPFREWSQRHPGASMYDYKLWQHKLRRKNMNWLQRSLTNKIPKSR